jgi:hypothetical protein
MDRNHAAMIMADAAWRLRGRLSTGKKAGS